MSSADHPLVKKLEEKLLPDFRKIAERINNSFPNIIATVDSSSVGSLTEYQGHGFYIDCIIEDAFDDAPDNVCLDVGLSFLTTLPRIRAGVGWGHPSGTSEAEFKDWGGGFPTEGMIVTEEILEELYNDLPRLYEALFKALERRKPADE